MESLMASRSSKNEVNAALSLKANVSDVASTIQQISKALDSKLCHEEAQDILKTYVIRDEIDILMSQQNKKTGYDDSDNLEDKISELDHKLEEYCNGIIEQFDKVPDKDELFALKVFFESYKNRLKLI